MSAKVARALLVFGTTAQSVQAKAKLAEMLAERMNDEAPEARTSYICMSLRQFLGAKMEPNGDMVASGPLIKKPVLIFEGHHASAAREAWLEVREEALKDYVLGGTAGLVRRSGAGAKPIKQLDLPFIDQPAGEQPAGEQPASEQQPAKRVRRTKAQIEQDKAASRVLTTEESAKMDSIQKVNPEAQPLKNTPQGEGEA